MLGSDDQSATTFDPGTLTANTHYYWQIIVTNEHGKTTNGPIWDFLTESEIQFSYNEYFTTYLNVAVVSISTFDVETTGYFWDYIHEVENTGSIHIDEPIELQNCVAPEECLSIGLHLDEQRKIHAAKSAHAIWLDKNNILPWNIHEYSDNELRGLPDRDS